MGEMNASMLLILILAAAVIGFALGCIFWKQKDSLKEQKKKVKTCKDTDYLFISAFLRAREPQLLILEFPVILCPDLRRLFLGLRADRGGLGFGVGKDAGGNFLNSVHRFALFYGVTC